MVTRQKAEEKPSEEKPNEEKPNEEKPTEQKEPLKLTGLEIDGIAISPTFSSDVTEYTALLEDLSIKNADVKASANREGAKIEITGNENLVEGENTIVITVKDGDESKTYQIVLTKQEKQPTEDINAIVAGTTTVERKGVNFVFIIVISVVAVVALAAGIAFIITQIRYKKANKSGMVDFTGISGEEEEIKPRREKYKDDGDDDFPPRGRSGKHF